MVNITSNYFSIEIRNLFHSEINLGYHGATSVAEVDIAIFAILEDLADCLKVRINMNLFLFLFDCKMDCLRKQIFNQPCNEQPSWSATKIKNSSLSHYYSKYTPAMFGTKLSKEEQLMKKFITRRLFLWSW